MNNGRYDVHTDRQTTRVGALHVTLTIFHAVGQILQAFSTSLFSTEKSCVYLFNYLVCTCAVNV